MIITTLHRVDIEYSADSIEWCTHPEYRDFFVCGTYQLEGDNVNSSSPPCRRIGRIYFYRFNKTTNELIELQRLETAAILDMKWMPNHLNVPLLAVANAMGQIKVYEIDQNKLHLRSELHLNEECHNLLTLSLDCGILSFHNERHIIASDSRGDVSYLQYSESGSLKRIHTWSAHNFEAWTCCYDKWDMNRIYTGGDDTFLHAFDVRTYERTLTNRSHIAGVTIVHSYPHKENILLTGSYDEHLRIFDTRALSKPLGQINLKGGIWRIKSDPKMYGLLLVACMYNNFRIVGLLGENCDTPNLLAEYTEHESICYGADWSFDVENSNQQLHMATCSFYDHKLCLSKVDYKKD